MNTDLHRLEDLPTYERVVVRRELHRSRRQVTRNRSCSTKRRFHDSQHAHSFVHHMMTKKGDGFDPQRVYRCPFCKGFHTTHKGTNDERREDSGHQGPPGEAQA